MSLALVAVAEDQLVEQEFATELAQIRAINADLETASAQQLAEWAVLLDAGAAVAKLRGAAAVMREATATRVRAQRRLGEIALDDGGVYERVGIPRLQGMGRHSGPWLERLANLPAEVFDKTVNEMTAADCLCQPPEVIEGARLRHLTLVESNPFGYIYKLTWDDPDKPLYVFGHGAIGRERLYCSLTRAREHLREKYGPPEREPRETTTLGHKHSELRRLSKELERLREDLTGDQRRFTEKAELKLMEAAEFLWKAWSQ